MDPRRNIFVRNVHCRNISTVNTQVDGKVAAVCSFDSTDGLCDLLISAVKSQWCAGAFGSDSFTISTENTNTACEHMVYESTDLAFVTYERHNRLTTGSLAKRRLTLTLRNETMADVVDKKLVCVARVNLCFTNVTVELDKYAPADTYTISFGSFHVIGNPILDARTSMELQK